MEKRTFLAAVVGAIGAVLLGRPARADKKEPEPSPHAAALSLVFREAAARIREVDREEWWFDTKERAWVVVRPFAPGFIDSTHLFTVTYRIDGRTAAAWHVDTKKGKVAEVPEADRERRGVPADPARKG
jgi:hypothetical protein